MKIDNFVFALLLCSWASISFGAESKSINRFTERDMSSAKLKLENNDFETAVKGPQGYEFTGWILSHGTKSSAVKIGSGFNSNLSIALSASSDHGADTELFSVYSIVHIPKQWQSAQANFSVSAWVWSDKTGVASLKIKSITGKDAVSAFHPGNGRWEYLTVVYPYPGLIEEKVEIHLVSMGGGVARFDKVQPIIIIDNRFEGVSDECWPFRERVTYKKGNRIRIVVVGNSTINGKAEAAKNATFSYILQSKLESLFPNRFEVMNYGLCGWNLPSQIVSLEKHLHFSLWCSGASWCQHEGYINHDNILKKGIIGHQNKDNEATLHDLRPDVILLSSMWNDLWRTLKTRDLGMGYPFADEADLLKDVPFSVIYIKSLFNYLDDPSRANYLVADMVLQQAMKNKAGLSRLPSDFEGYMRDGNFKKLSHNAEQKYRFLLTTFIEKAKRWTTVWNMSLPSRFGASFNENLNSLVSANIIESNKLEDYKINAFIDADVERIQNSEIEMVSMKLAVPFVNLSQVYRNEHRQATPREHENMGYFIGNLRDNAHFSYRGNEYLADRFYSEMVKEFAALAKTGAGNSLTQF